MKSLLPTALIVVLASVTAGCTTFSDNDTAAKVNGTKLTQDDLRQLATDKGVTSDDVVQLDAVRGELTRWIQSQVIDDEQAADLYGQGPGVAGTICLQAIVVADEADADAALTDLRGGTPFAEVFDSVNIDTTLPDEGVLPCTSSDQLEANADEPLIEAAQQLTAAHPFEKAELLDNTGALAAYAIIGMRPFDQLADADHDTVVGALDVSNLLAGIDVYVNPRYGTFDAVTRRVVGLS